MRRAITDNAGNLFISAITAFEIGIKHRRRGMDLPLPPADWIARALEHHRVQEIPVDWRIAERSTSLPPLHRDPADRIITATSFITAVSILPRTVRSASSRCRSGLGLRMTDCATRG